ncbi:MAG TPA: family 10 glycosylhydrolase, partial [Longimicrobiales bacterium]|nr:family 10 glycosylhydrolase [Longimicrobiales bacterium]
PAACAPGAPDTPVPDDVPPLEREFRGVWVASVGNIDWPSEPGLPPDSQRAELVAILDRAVELGLNAIVLQVRPAGDALYASDLEPWSEYLTGAMGEAPDPYYDPLEFAVRAAHDRGLELHAWFNPYRARHPSAEAPASADHLSRTRPDLVVEYGGYQWMDPGEPDVQDHSIAVMLDVVRRYDVDGIHLDDYFYPYRVTDSAGVEIPFPDDASWARYVAGGGTLDRDDWRRRNVDTFVARLYREIKAEKPWVRFGVSPIGIWRPDHPRGICCFDAYESIYADARKWFMEGSLDYFVPQLYRPMADTLIPFPRLLGWWAEQNHQDRHLWPGLIPNRVRRSAPAGQEAEGQAARQDRDSWFADEIVGQINVTRGHPGASGHVHFSARSLMANPDGLADDLRDRLYRLPALPPASTWLDDDPPARPRVTVSVWSPASSGAPASAGSAPSLQLTPADAREVRWWVVRSRYEEGWETAVVPGVRRTVALRRAPNTGRAGSDATVPGAATGGPGQPRSAALPSEVVVTAVDRVGNESAPVRVPISRGST